MKRKIKWSIDEKIEHEDILMIEKAWEIIFPSEYVNIIENHHEGHARTLLGDGRLTLCGIDIPSWRGGRASIALLAYKGYGDMETWRIITCYKAFKECLPEPKRIFPFAEDGGGNIFFFDYRKNELEPSIVFLDHEESIAEGDLFESDLEERTLAEWQESTLHPVANSFSEFLDKITPDEE